MSAERSVVQHYDGPIDTDEVLAWVEKYGHPEGWAKAAQAAHSKTEDLLAENARLREAAVSEDVLRIAAEHIGEFADILRAARSEHRAELADDFAQALLSASDDEAVDWDAVLADLHKREREANES